MRASRFFIWTVRPTPLLLVFTTAQLVLGFRSVLMRGGGVTIKEFPLLARVGLFSFT